MCAYVCVYVYTHKQWIWNFPKSLIHLHTYIWSRKALWPTPGDQDPWKGPPSISIRALHIQPVLPGAFFWVDNPVRKRYPAFVFPERTPPSCQIWDAAKNLSVCIEEGKVKRCPSDNHRAACPDFFLFTNMHMRSNLVALVILRGDQKSSWILIKSVASRGHGCFRVWLMPS